MFASKYLQKRIHTDTGPSATYVPDFMTLEHVFA
jgi:hypothetical protein